MMNRDKAVPPGRASAETGGYEPIIAALRHKQYQSAEGQTLEQLRHSPLDAQLWCYLGEALLHQGFGDAARRVFERAWLLDPQAVWTDAVFRLLDRIPQGASRGDIDELLAVPEVKVTAAVLVRDEKERIVRCLGSLTAAVDEIVVVDTGSVDGTVEQVRSLFPKAKVVEIGWEDDFAAARNAGLAHCTGDWVIWIDADEELHPDDIPQIRTVAALFRGASPAVLLCIGQINEVRKGDVRTNYSMVRMFETDRHFRFVGRVHEQVEPVGEGAKAKTWMRRPIRIRVFHDGYTRESVQNKDKWRRNIELLKKSIADDPDNPAWWFFLARETLASGDPGMAMEYFRTTEKLARKAPAFARRTEMYMYMAGICYADKDWEEAEQLCRKALEIAPGFPDAHFLLAQIRLRQSSELLQEAERQVRQARDAAITYRGPAAADDGIPGWKADSMLGDLALRSGNLAKAKAVYAAVSRRFPEAPGIREKLAYIEGQRRQLNAGTLSGNSGSPSVDVGSLSGNSDAPSDKS